MSRSTVMLGLGFLVLAICCATPSTASANVAHQMHPNRARGAGDDKTLSRHDPDNINLFNGNLALSIPLGGEYPLARDFSYRIALHYNSNAWDLSSKPGGIYAASPAKFSNAGVGWDLSFGRLIDPFAANNELRKWVYVGPDGSAHPFYADLHADKPEAEDSVYYTRDSTYHRLIQVSATQTTVESPDGTIRTFELSSNEWQLIKIADRFDNYLAISYATPNVWSLSDNHGRTHTVRFMPDPAGHYPAVVDRVELAAFNGDTAVYTFSYATGAFPRPSIDNDPNTSPAVTIPLLAGVTAPDGSRHSFTHHPANAPHESAARLAGVQFPTLGKIEWTYGVYSFTTAGCPTALGPGYRSNTGVITRRMVNNAGWVMGTWRFTPALRPGPCALPSGDQVWVEDGVPAGAITTGAWHWIGTNPSAASGNFSHQSELVANAVHQHYFHNATQALTINAGDVLVAYVYLDPSNPPSEVMLQWYESGSWEHRAYWGANRIAWGADGTVSRRYMGPLPAAGQWVRLEVPASLVGLEGRTANGMAFTLFGGRATWDRAGKNGTAGQGDQEFCTTVQTPLGDKTEHYFIVNTLSPSGWWHKARYAMPGTDRFYDATGSRNLSKAIYDCDEAGNNCRLMRTDYVRYEQDYSPDPAAADVGVSTNRREVSRRTMYQDDVENGVVRFADTDRSDFDGLGHYRRTITNGNFGKGNVRDHFLNYNPTSGTYPSAGFTVPSPTSPWILNTFNRQKVVEGGSSQTMEFCHDRSNGFLQRIRRWRTTDPNGTAGDKDVITLHVKSPTGEVGQQQYYGGDVQPVGTGDLCTLALPATDQYQIRHQYQYGVLAGSRFYTGTGQTFGQKFVDHDVDQNTGLVKRTRDSAGIATDFEYDAMGRVTWIKPQSGHGAWRKHEYLVATGHTWNGQREHITTYSNGGAAVLLAEMNVFDGFGLLWAKQKLMPDGAWATRHNQYNAMGWLTHKSEFATDQIRWEQYLNYDPFGRARLVTPQDGAQHNISYEYAGISTMKRTVPTAVSYNESTGVINEQPRSSTETYDRQGRLWKEIRHTVDRFGTPRDVVTEHFHDAAGRLTETKVDGARQGSLYTYDGRGFLSSDFHDSGNGSVTVTYLNNDAFGRPRRTQRHNHALNSVAAYDSSYDRAGRLTRVFDPNNASKVWKEFTYADSNGTGDWRAGKLWKAKRLNDMSQFLSSHGITNAFVTETYTYGGTGGRLSRLETEFNDTLGRLEKFAQDYSYTETGEVREIGYPNSLPGSSVNIGRERKVTNNYTRGMLTSVSGTYNSQPENWATSISYHPNGLISQIAHANGVTTNVARDPNGFIRAAAVTTVGAKNIYNGLADLNTGAFQYDGAGSLVRAGSDYFVPEATAESPSQPSPPLSGSSPCDRGWEDLLGMIYAAGDDQCQAKAFYYYSASDRLYKMENGLIEAGAKITYFYDQNGRLLTEYMTNHAHYQPWPSLWEYTRDYIYRGTKVLAVDEKRRESTLNSTLHYHTGFGAKGIRTDAKGYNKN